MTSWLSVDPGYRVRFVDTTQVLLFQVTLCGGVGGVVGIVCSHPSTEPWDTQYLVVQAPCPQLLHRHWEGLHVCLLENIHHRFVVISSRAVFFW